MSRIDEVTGKKPLRGNTRSFSMNHSPRRWELNLQNVTIIENGKKKNVRVCSKTLKTLRRDKKIYDHKKILADREQRNKFKQNNK